MVTGSVKNLIFDLGGVILDLSVADTLKSFAQLSGLPIDKVKERFISSPEFEQYERGELDDDQFRNSVRSIYGASANEEELDACWNAMLLGIPAIKLELLTQLKTQYRVFLLSNTNTIHLKYINTKIFTGKSGEKSLDDYFHRSYYSHLMGKRKPEAAIFEQVLAENNLIAGETLFLDDNADNIAGAAALGIQTLHVTHPDLILKHFNR